METLVVRGVSKGDCLEKIANKYGIWATILREKKFQSSGFLGLFPREWVEVEFCLSPQRGLALQNGEPAIPTPAVMPARKVAGGGTAAAMPMTVSAPQATISRDDTTLDFTEAKKRVLAAAGRDPDQIFQKMREQEEKEDAQQEAQRRILDELKEIREKMESSKAAAPKEDPPTLMRMVQLLRLNDFSESYTLDLLERARKEMALETLQDFNAVQERYLEWIGESVRIFHSPDKRETNGFTKEPKIMALVGPTGVGKTTTVAKLAAIYGLGNSGRGPLSVRIITIDAFRIGAVDQIMRYGRIMEMPVSCVDNRRDLLKEIDLHSEETDLILVDTIGRSPGDSTKLGEMKEMLDVCGPKAEIHLVLSAGTKSSDIEHILRQFEPFNYQAVLLTKFDETRHVGNVISALAAKDKPVSFVTDGQDVPKYIKKASVVWFLTNLEEFRVDREKIEKRFPSGEADQFQWS